MHSFIDSSAGFELTGSNQELEQVTIVEIIGLDSAGLPNRFVGGIQHDARYTAYLSPTK